MLKQMIQALREFMKASKPMFAILIVAMFAFGAFFYRACGPENPTIDPIKVEEPVEEPAEEPPEEVEAEVEVSWSLFSTPAYAQESNPETYYGSCCYQDDWEWECKDGWGITEDWCEERDGNYVLWGHCEDAECPPVGSCCIDCEEPGDITTCEDDVEQAECAAADGDWLDDVECDQRDDCDTECPVIELGSGCLAGGDCLHMVTEEEYYEHEASIENGWYDGLGCNEIACQTVPTMPLRGLVLIAAVLTLITMYVGRSKWKRTREKP